MSRRTTRASRRSPDADDPAAGDTLPAAHVIERGGKWPVSSDPAHPFGNPPIDLPEVLPATDADGNVTEQPADDGSET